MSRSKMWEASGVKAIDSGTANLPKPMSAESGASTQSMPAVRAQQLADVAQAVYERGGPGIHVPLDSSHALVAVLKAALEREAKERSGKQWKVGLLSCVLTQSRQKLENCKQVTAEVACKDALLHLRCKCCASANMSLFELPPNYTSSVRI